VIALITYDLLQTHLITYTSGGARELPDNEISKMFTVKNKLGLHARAAAGFVRLSSKFECEVHIAKDGYIVNGKSILGVLSLAAAKGSEIEIFTNGDDAQDALIQIEEFIESGFGEGI